MASSRIFNAVSQEISTQSKYIRGGRGITRSTKVMRVPTQVLTEFDDLLAHWRKACDSSPTSPRYEKLREFLSELEDLLPPVPSDH